MSDVFLSYAREDEARVRALATELARFGWTVWSDERIRTSAEFDDVIERELETAACVVVVWSRSSAASGWVRAEAGAANDQGKLVPVSFERDVVPPLRFRQLNMAILESGALSTTSEGTLGMLAEIARLTGKPPVGVDHRVLEGRGDGAVSGARTVTVGKWQLIHRMAGARVRFVFDLHPNGTLSGKFTLLSSSGPNLLGVGRLTPPKRFSNSRCRPPVVGRYDASRSSSGSMTTARTARFRGTLARPAWSD